MALFVAGRACSLSMKNHEDYMSILLGHCEAQSAEAIHEVPVAALVVMNDEIIGLAVNERESRNSILAHAELLALERAAAKHGDWNLSGATIYVTLEPCAMCAGAIIQSHIAKVVFGAYDAKSGAFGSRYQLATSKLEISGGVLDQECLKLLKDFFAQRR